MKWNTQWLLGRLEKPTGPVDAVIDTDTYNEIDDQFALAYLIKNSDRIRLRGIHAAPFHNRKSTGPADGMEKSHAEIHRVLEVMERQDLAPLVKKGSDRYLPNEETPVPSEAAEELVRLALAQDPERPLYVVAIGAITNVASALLLRPEIRERIVVVWLGGHAYHWHDNREFNLFQDVAAGRVVFGCGVPLVQLPCMGVVSAFSTGAAELERFLRGKNKLCDYLVDITTRDGAAESVHQCWTRAIWDVTAVAWLLEGGFLLDRLEHSPIPEYDDRYAFDGRRHLIRYVYHVNRDALMEDLFRKLGE